MSNDGGRNGKQPSFRSPTATAPHPRIIPQSQIRGTISELPEPDQTVLRQRDSEEFSAAGSAERTGLTVAAMKARLQRARTGLRERLNA